MEIVNIMVWIYLILVIKKSIGLNIGYIDDDFVVIDVCMVFFYFKFFNVNKWFLVDVKVRCSNL